MSELDIAFLVALVFAAVLHLDLAKELKKTKERIEVLEFNHEASYCDHPTAESKSTHFIREV